MSATSTVKRERCAICTRPLRNCICSLIRPTANRIDVLLLQHPDETNNAKNTAGLLQLSLKNSQLKIGEQFPADTLHHWLFSGDKQPLLLYPQTPEAHAMGLSVPQTTTLTDLLEIAPNTSVNTPLRLVVIDGTWRKSRKMLYLNPVLQSLPRFSLKEHPASIYQIRKAHSENQLSTLEASCYALRQLEQQQVDYAPLLEAMQQFVAQQRAFIPAPIANSTER